MDANFKGETYIKPFPISDSITLFLRESILSGGLKPGQKINEREIAESLGVSRSPLREALRDMAKEGLVTILPRKGAIVAELSEKELFEIFETREMIELYAIELIKNHSVENYEELKKSLKPDPTQFDKTEFEMNEYLSEVIKFHLALVKTSGNSMLYEHYQILSNSLRRYQLLAATIPSRMELSVEEHRTIFDALIKGKFKAAKDLLKRHLEAMKLKITDELDLPNQDPNMVKGD